jgi:hypothetical protein
MKSQRGVVNPRVEISWTFSMEAKKKKTNKGAGYCEGLKRVGGGPQVWKNKKERERKERERGKEGRRWVLVFDDEGKEMVKVKGR